MQYPGRPLRDGLELFSGSCLEPNVPESSRPWRRASRAVTLGKLQQLKWAQITWLKSFLFCQIGSWISFLFFLRYDHVFLLHKAISHFSPLHKNEMFVYIGCVIVALNGNYCVFKERSCHIVHWLWEPDRIKTCNVREKQGERRLFTFYFSCFWKLFSSTYLKKNFGRPLQKTQINLSWRFSCLLPSWPQPLLCHRLRTLAERYVTPA